MLRALVANLVATEDDFLRVRLKSLRWNHNRNHIRVLIVFFEFAVNSST